MQLKITLKIKKIQEKIDKNKIGDLVSILKHETYKE